jgi:hypothetical protein
MANRHYSVNKECDITLNFKIRVKSISNYYHLTEENITQVLDNLENELKSHFLWKISQESRIEDIGVDYVIFEMED